ncbi:Carbohydrate family 9 binding domain-like [Candidatus Kryptobacter tengchongensis]|nr:Carbohydrate family 9 binding domain-like [Candidatus Kryptobacter tengchongensis]
MRGLLLILLTFASMQLVNSQTEYRIKALKIDGVINIDGKLEEEFWKHAEKVELKYEVQITDNEPASQKTTAMVLYDGLNLYFGFVCYDTNPNEIRAHITDRDKIWEDDFIILIIDTYGDNQNAYELAVNPYGIQGDGMRTGNSEDIMFDFVWHSAGLISDSGWTVEIAIPFKSLRFPKRENQEWNILIGRNYPRKSRFVFSWTPVDKNNPCLLCQSGKLTGLDDIGSVKFVEVLPYVMSYQSGSIRSYTDPSLGMKNEPIRVRGGTGVKFSPNPELTIEGVLNPDFSQVETDAYQISVNTTFALYYPEKRPFFFEGSEVFKTPVNVFYSRMINDPLFAFKLKQKSNNLTIAYLSSLDEKTPFIIPGEEGSSTVQTGLRSLVNLGRVRYDFGEQSYAGLLFTARNLSNSYNYVGGLDWNYFFWKSYYFRGQILYSATKEINDSLLFSSQRKFGETSYDATFNGERYSGVGMLFRFLRDTKHHGFVISYRDFSPTFQPHLGFVTANNRRQINIENRFTFYPKNSIVDIAFVLVEGGLVFNYSGTRKERWVVVGAGLQLKTQTDVFVGFLPVNDEIFGGRKFEKIHRIFANVYSVPFKFLTLQFNGEYGRKIYRTSEPRLGLSKDFNVYFKLKPTEKIELSIWYTKARLEDEKTKELFYDGYVAGLVGIYQFNPNLFLRLITQYDSFSGSVQFFPLLSFKLNPFTIFYVGSTINLLDFGEPYGVRQTNREFFLKVQYLLRD